MNPSDIPVRENGGGWENRVVASWFNQIRTALIDLFGGGSIGETDFTLANNQGSAANVTGLSVSSASYRGAVVEYDITRKTDTASSEVRSMGQMFLQYRAQSSAWEIAGIQENGDDAGITFSVTSGGQVQYTSTNISGSNYVGKLTFRVRTFDV